MKIRYECANCRFSFGAFDLGTETFTARQQAMEKAGESPPAICPHCGGNVGIVTLGAFRPTGRGLALTFVLTALEWFMLMGFVTLSILGSSPDSIPADQKAKNLRETRILVVRLGLCSMPVGIALVAAGLFMARRSKNINELPAPKSQPPGETAITIPIAILGGAAALGLIFLGLPALAGPELKVHPSLGQLAFGSGLGVLAAVCGQSILYKFCREKLTA